jgi:pimeloyl-ACP methyl ester carboxylesterase
VAAAFQAEGLGTLLVDLLTAEESARDAVTAELRFDIDLLTGRLAGAVDWLARTYGPDLAIGLYGASTGASAALRCAAERPVEVRAVVSRGGLADLAGEALERVGAPTLLIVGEADPIVLELNRVARERLLAESELVVVPGAGHLFEEPGALERVAELSAGWFRRHLA